MGSSEAVGALFDLDGTLYTGHIWQDLVAHHRAVGQQRRWVAAYLARNLAPWPLYKLGLLSQAAFFQAWGETLGWLLRGWTPARGQALFEELAEGRIVPNLRPPVLARLRNHLADGHLVVLVSGAFEPLLATVAGRLGVAHAVGTPLQVRGGRYTGRIEPPLCQYEGKPLRLRAYLAERGLALDWAASFAYADREVDLPLLEMVGRPVVVCPDAALLARARAGGWEVLEGQVCNESGS